MCVCPYENLVQPPYNENSSIKWLLKAKANILCSSRSSTNNIFWSPVRDKKNWMLRYHKYSQHLIADRSLLSSANIIFSKNPQILSYWWIEQWSERK